MFCICSNMQLPVMEAVMKTDKVHLPAPQEFDGSPFKLLVKENGRLVRRGKDMATEAGPPAGHGSVRSAPPDRPIIWDWG